MGSGSRWREEGGKKKEVVVEGGGSNSPFLITLFAQGFRRPEALPTKKSSAREEEDEKCEREQESERIERAREERRRKKETSLGLDKRE